MTHLLPNLPYSTSALSPVLSVRTLEIHHGKHHATYLAKLDQLIAGTNLEDQPLEAIIHATANDVSRRAIFNNAAQAWNHQFFWESMTMPGSRQPGAAAAKLIKATFGDVDSFAKAFVEAGRNHFGSGWVWALGTRSRIQIVTTANADTPIVRGKRPLLVCDLWEHAYYLDYQQARERFLQEFAAKLIDWERVEARLVGALKVEKKEAA